MEGRFGIVGYGELGKQVRRLALGSIPEQDFIFFDDILYEKRAPQSAPLHDCFKSEYQHLEFCIGVGYRHPKFRVELVKHLKEAGRKLPNFVHPSCYVSKSAKVGEGSVLYPMCNVDANVNLGLGTLLNNSVVVSHDTVIECGSYLSPGVVVSGMCAIGEGCFIGSGTIVSNGVKIGAYSKVGIGSVVRADVGEELSVIGNPARVVAELNLT